MLSVNPVMDNLVSGRQKGERALRVKIQSVFCGGVSPPDYTRACTDGSRYLHCPGKDNGNTAVVPIPKALVVASQLALPSPLTLTDRQ